MASTSQSPDVFTNIKLEGEQKQSLAGPVRKTQRAPVSCAACAKRKVKCEKVFPCSRCIKKGLGDQCKRELVEVKGRVVGGQADEEIVRREFTIEDLQAENRALRRLLKREGKVPTPAELRGVFESPPPVAATPLPQPPYLAPPPVAPTPLAPPFSSRPLVSPSSRWEATEDVDGMLTADLTTVGMSMGVDGDVLAKQPRAVSPDVSYLIPFVPGVTRSTRLRYVLTLVPIPQSRDLVIRSLRLVGWIHGALFIDDFLQQHDRFLEAIQRGAIDEISVEWLSTYFAVIASGSYFLGGDWDQHRVCTPEQRTEFPRLWCSASIEMLHLSEFMTRHTLEACQAICILTLCAFNYAQGEMLVSLLHMGLRIAQNLNLHILVAEPEGKDVLPPPGLRSRELKRAIWSALSLGDALSPSSSQPHSLFIPEGISVPQANLPPDRIIEGQPFNPEPLSTFTQQSVHIFLNHVGRLFRRFNRQFWSADSLEEQYRLVEDADAQLLGIVDQFPQLKVSDEPYPQYIDFDKEIPFQRWAQHHLQVNRPRLRMSLYRCFLRKSYSDPQFLKSRQICLDGAREILKERQRPVPALFDRAWHITSDTVAAGVILCALYREEKAPEERHRLRSEVLALIAVLEKGGADNPLVQLGISLLSTYLAASPPTPPPPFIAPLDISLRNAEPAAWAPTHPSYMGTAPFAHPHEPVGFPPPPQLPYPAPSHHYDPILAPYPAAPTPSAPGSAADAFPDLWSSLELAGGGGAFDPFGGWEEAASYTTLDWTYAGGERAGAGGFSGGYDPSRPAF